MWLPSCHEGKINSGGGDWISQRRRVSVMEIALKSCPLDTSSSTILNTPHKRKRGQSPVKELIKATQLDTAVASSLTSSPSHKRAKLLRIEIPSNLNSGLSDTITPTLSDSSLFTASPTTDSIFGDLDDIPSIVPLPDAFLATRNAPPIPGLFFDPTIILPQDLTDSVMGFCMKTYFKYPRSNQVMLFGRLIPTPDTTSGLPTILLELLEKLSVLLKPTVPSDTYAILFPEKPTMARQAIINLYQPGEGITPHVDLLGRYGDGIIGVSFNSGSVMRFDKVVPTEPAAESEKSEHRTRLDLYLPERSIVILSEEARYHWTHGIEKKTRDFVSLSTVDGDSIDASGLEKGAWIERGVRMSITFRWLLPGADVVGEPQGSD
ncbi:unnamed protein product [Cyclocybe aegerita]|uniref:Fe2OG dioxygenase domain-containing protein n=1 Tax=Cyclocybe aegerita TaxID=1973307 RepID=A0A8S0XKF2_CYCAE|nr:unnamed protein product [Cyclocybe aegerita]